MDEDIDIGEEVSSDPWTHKEVHSNLNQSAPSFNEDWVQEYAPDYNIRNEWEDLDDDEHAIENLLPLQEENYYYEQQYGASDTEWTPQEETRLYEGLQKFGKDIKKLTIYLESRSEEDIINYLQKHYPELNTKKSRKPKSVKVEGSQTATNSIKNVTKNSKMNGGTTSSSSHLPSHNTPWTEDENKIFEEGLKLYGRGCWKEISLMIKTRNALQVKNHARQYFKKLEKIDPTLINTFDLTPKKKSTTTTNKRTGSHSNKQSSVDKVNVVKSNTLVVIKKEEEDLSEDIDIGEDDLDPSLLSITSSTTATTTTITSLNSKINDPVKSPETSKLYANVNDIIPENEVNSSITNSSINNNNSTTIEEEEYYWQEPAEEKVLDLNIISEEEKEFNYEFFSGNPVKTPERYMKIRDFIITAWNQCKPNYLSKTSVRTGLKDCGDVNAIGRVHQFLESLGAINYGTLKPLRCIKKKKPISSNSTLILQNSGSVNTTVTSSSTSPLLSSTSVNNLNNEDGRRKRKVRTQQGEWISEEEFKKSENITTDHTIKSMANSTMINNNNTLKRKHKSHIHNTMEGHYDPFKLIQCSKYSDKLTPPFHVSISSDALLIMDFHSHLVRSEVIGLLGGMYYEETKTIKITVAIPCNSNSTGIQCEMDPLSEMDARDVLNKLKLTVVGWYHSHPTFNPSPSLRDIENQSNYQKLFSRSDNIEPFIGVIVSPFIPNSNNLNSVFNLVSISHQLDPIHHHRIPYELPYSKDDNEDKIPVTIYNQITQLFHKYAGTDSFVDFAQSYYFKDNCTYLDKLLAALSVHIKVDYEKDKILDYIQELVKSESYFNTDQIIPD